MAKNGPELHSSLGALPEAPADDLEQVRASRDASISSAVLSEVAIDLMLEDAKGAAQHRTSHEFEHQRMIHDAAVAAARDGECAPEWADEPPHHHSYRYEVSDSRETESSLDGIAELRMEILD